MRLGDRLAFHFLGWLPDDDARHGPGFRSFAKAVLVEEIVRVETIGIMAQTPQA